MEWFIYNLLKDCGLHHNNPIQILPGVWLKIWLEARGSEGMVFVAETLQFVCDWR